MIQEQCPRTVFQTVHNTVHCNRWVVCTMRARCRVAAQHHCRGRARWRCRRALLRALGAHACLVSRDTKGCVATPGPLPCPGQVETPNSGRDPKQARTCHDTRKCVATPISGHLVVSRRQGPCRDTPTLPTPRHENHVPTKDQPSPSLSHVATQKLMSRPGGQDLCRARTQN